MISKIILKKIASYWDNQAVLDTDKKFNFIYWLNGSWKTTLSNFLQNKDNEVFQYCYIE